MTPALAAQESRDRVVEDSSTPSGMVVPHFFSSPDVHPFEQVEWAVREAKIEDEKGKVIFRQEGCEVPTFWSPMALNIAASKYFYGEQGTGERESSIKQLIHRVTRTVSDWGIAGGYFASREDGERFYSELTFLCLHQYGSFNSPVWFNVGIYHQYGVSGSTTNWRWDKSQDQVVPVENGFQYPQGSACFIQSVGDSMQEIMQLATNEAMLFKYGSGTGTDLSTIRSRREKVSGGGKPSGPLSFMKIYDATAGAISSGGRTRRAAKIQTLKCWHPDILEFIDCKQKEEKKALALIEAGYEANFNGEAYSTVMFQNSNLSVRVSDDFLSKAESGQDWQTRAVTTGEVMGTYKADFLLDRIAEGTWFCGDPGVQYEDTVNRWHTCSNTAPINSTNPCGEYAFIDETACNLASLNILRFLLPDGTFDHKVFLAAVAIFITAQEILVDNAGYPTDKIARNSHDFRPLGLGYANLGSLLMAMGIPYDSAKGRAWAGAITALMHGQAYLTSADHSSNLGPFARYEENKEPMLRVIGMHAGALQGIDRTLVPHDLMEDLINLWGECRTEGQKHGYRNSQVTLLAPTGTIAFLMDCDTTGVEPDIALVKYKQLAGRGMLKIVNQTVPRALEKLGYNSVEIGAISQYIEVHDKIEGAPVLRPEHLEVFDCAFAPKEGGRSIHYKGHLRMLAAVQPFLSGAISKTTNMPPDATVADIRKAYLEGWKLGLKSLTIYRDGSKGSQPLSTNKDHTRSEATPVVKPQRTRLPETRNSITHKFNIQGHEGYFNVGFYPDGSPGELFITMAKEGSTIGGLMDVLGTSISIGLQYGVPLGVFVNKFAHSRFEPAGFTKNPDIPIASSIADYIFRWLGNRFITGYKELNGIHRENGTELSLDNPLETAVQKRREQFLSFQSDAPACDNCGSLTVRSGNCYRCHNCGNSLGCS